MFSRILCIIEYLLIALMKIQLNHFISSSYFNSYIYFNRLEPNKNLRHIQIFDKINLIS